MSGGMPSFQWGALRARVSSAIEDMSQRKRTLLGWSLFIPVFFALNGSLNSTTLPTRMGLLVIALSLGIFANRLLDSFWGSRSEKVNSFRAASQGFLFPLLIISALFVQVPVAARSGAGGGGLPLVIAWLLYALVSPSHEPEDFPLAHLRLRIVRASTARVAFNWVGTIGLVWFLSGTLRDWGVKTAIPTVSLTLLVGVSVSSLRVYGRVRKLSTLIHVEAQCLARDLEELRESTGSKEQAEKRSTTRRTWDNLHRLLQNRVDTGFHRYGTFVLPQGALKELEEKALSAIDATPTEATHEAVLHDLDIIKKACAVRLDDVA